MRKSVMGQMLKKVAVDVAVIGMIFIAAVGIYANDQINPAQGDGRLIERRGRGFGTLTFKIA
jgi:hypothetical protein